MKAPASHAWLRIVLLLTALHLSSASCASSKHARQAGSSVGGQRSRRMQGASAPVDERRCDEKGEDRIVNQYDTSGDQMPDVRKVFRRVGTFPDYRLILLCREVDVNQDGRKDIIRYYSDLGVPQREETDRNLDGRMDEVRIFQSNQTVQRQLDSDRDGRLDTKIFYRNGAPHRIERDSRGRSQQTWQPDHWEYVESGRIVRIGTDIDGDGSVDVWDRDLSATTPSEEGTSPASPTDDATAVPKP